MTEINETRVIENSNYNYNIYVIQHNERNDGCDFSLSDSPPLCSKHDIIAIFKAEKPRVGGLNISPNVKGQLDTMLNILKQQFPNAIFSGTPEQEKLVQFVANIIVKRRPKLYLATYNAGELQVPFFPFSTA